MRGIRRNRYYRCFFYFMVVVERTNLPLFVNIDSQSLIISFEYRMTKSFIRRVKQKYNRHFHRSSNQYFIAANLVAIRVDERILIYTNL